ncbi:MAG: 4Fe-4S dicluster domain-containing protein [Psychromonas sp.]
MLRDIIEIDETLCNGCGDCVPACHEGALQIIDNKARLISDLMCDGLGACLGDCPTGAMKVIQREAVPYDEREVMVNIIKGGDKVIKAHLEHMLDHNEQAYYAIAIAVLKEQNLPIPECTVKVAKPIETDDLAPLSDDNSSHQSNKSQLSHWPIQLHLINPTSPDFNNADLLLAADCSAFAAPNFHQKYLAGRKLIIACPKLDENQDSYVEKLSLLIRYGQLKSLTILRMDVPCCGGLAQLTQKARQHAKKEFAVNEITINKQGLEI